MAKLFAFVFVALVVVALVYAEEKKADLDPAAGHHHGHHGHHGGGGGGGGGGAGTGHHGWGGWNPHYDFGYKFRAGWGWH